MTSRYRRFVTPIAVGLLVTLALLLVGARQSDSYEARVSFLAVPVAQPVDQATQAQYGAIVSLGLPALSEIVRSPPVLQRALPGASPEELNVLADDTIVELVPSSAVARITVRNRDPRLAAVLVTSISDAVVRADLLAPVARLRPLDSSPVVRDTSVSVVLLAGLCVVTGLGAAVVTFLGRRLVTRRPDDDSAVRAALTEIGLHRSVAIIASDREALTDRITVLREAVGRPLRVVAASASPCSPVAAVRDELRVAAARGVEPCDEDGGTAVILAVDQEHTDAAELASVIHALPDDAKVVAVVVCGAEAPR